MTHLKPAGLRICRSGLSISNLWGFDPESGPMQRAEGAPANADYSATDPSGHQAGQEHAESKALHKH